MDKVTGQSANHNLFFFFFSFFSFLYIYIFYTRCWDIGKIFLMRHEENPTFEVAGKSDLRDMWKILLMRYRRRCEMLGNPTYETWRNYTYETWGKIILMNHSIIIDTKGSHKRQTDSNTGLTDNLVSKTIDPSW